MKMSILGNIRQKRLGYELGKKVISEADKIRFYNDLYDKKINKTIERLDYEFPTCVDIGTTNLCNSNCIMCPHSKLKKLGTMKISLFRKIIDNCKYLGIENVNLSFFGEPLLDKGLFEKIKYAKNKGLSIGLYSNGSLLNKDNIKNIIESQLDGISISIDGFSKVVYERIRKGLDFNKVEKGINDLIEFRNKNGNNKPIISLVLVELDENKHEIKEFYEKWRGKVNDIKILNMRNWTSNIDKENTKESINSRKLIRRPCLLLWTKLVIDWNGDVVLCCDDWNHKVVLGNLKKDTIERIWKGDKLNYIRYKHLHRDFNNLELCSKCNKNTIWWFL